MPLPRTYLRAPRIEWRKRRTRGRSNDPTTAPGQVGRGKMRGDGVREGVDERGGE